MFWYVLAGYVLYGLILTSIEYSKGSFTGASTSAALLGALVTQPLRRNMLSVSYWGDAPVSSIAFGFVKLVSKVLLMALALFLLVKWGGGLFGL
jgi:hypothetical protein